MQGAASGRRGRRFCGDVVKCSEEGLITSQHRSASNAIFAARCFGRDDVYEKLEVDRVIHIHHLSIIKETNIVEFYLSASDNHYLAPSLSQTSDHLRAYTQTPRHTAP